MAPQERFSRTMRIDIPPDLLAAEGAQPEEGGATQFKRKGRGTIRIRKPAQPAPAVPASQAAVVGGEEFQQLFENVYDGALLTELDGTIVGANVRAVEFLRSSKRELCKMSILEIISGTDETLLDAIRENLENDKFTLIQGYCLRLDESLFPAEIAVNRLRVSDHAYLCFFIRDKTVQREAEEQLRTEHRAIQTAATGIAIADLETRIVYGNPALLALWGYEHLDDLVGKTLGELIDDPDAIDRLADTVNQGHVWQEELEVRRLDDTSFHVQIAAAPNFDADGELVGMVYSFVDISDRILAEDATRQAERHRVMIESLGTACHHLGQPATVLLANLGMMQRHANEIHGPLSDLLSGSLEAAETLTEILHRLNAVNEYRTTPYLKGREEREADGSRILEI